MAGAGPAMASLTLIEVQSTFNTNKVNAMLKEAMAGPAPAMASFSMALTKMVDYGWSTLRECKWNYGCGFGCQVHHLVKCLGK